MKEEQPYFYICESLGEFTIKKTIFMKDSTDKARERCGNVFTTFNNAQSVLDKINNILKKKDD